MTVVIRRAQIRRGQAGVDITVKSAKDYARAFAPTWGMVMNHKNHVITDAQYTVAYRRILDKVPYKAWVWLAQQGVNGEVTVLCYCRNGQFCHTYLLAQYAAEKYPDLFVDGTKE